MLNTYLEASPPSKFILIHDSLKNPGDKFLDHIIDHNVKLNRKVHYFIFDGRFANSTKNILTVDCTKDFEPFDRLDGTIIFSSLAHMIFRFGLSGTYKLFNNMLRRCEQIVSILHTDLLENSSKIGQCFEHLATLNILISRSTERVNYTCRKPGGKVVKRTEDYKFVDGILSTTVVRKPDLSKIIPEETKRPEEMSTFKIGLTDGDRESRDSLVLPYLPKKGGEIVYEFEDVDDWDEEDPDDDLDL